MVSSTATQPAAARTLAIRTGITARSAVQTIHEMCAASISVHVSDETPETFLWTAIRDVCGHPLAMVSRVAVIARAAVSMFHSVSTELATRYSRGGDDSPTGSGFSGNTVTS